MTRRQYHYLVAGLPGITIGERLWTSRTEFRAQLEVHLHPDDLTQVKFVLLQEDHQNLLRFLQTGEIPVDTPGNFTLEDFRNPENRIPGTDPETKFMPGYITAVLAEYAADKSDTRSSQAAIGSPGQDETNNSGGSGNYGNNDLSGSNPRAHDASTIDLPGIQKQLDEGFFRLVMEQGNDFLRRYYSFQYDLDNLLAFIKSGLHGVDQQAFITGDTPHAQHLGQFAGRNLAKDPEMEYFDEITSISGNTSFAEEEKQIDHLQWQVIEDMNRFEYFTVDRVLGYLLQMQIAGRWEQLERERGEKQLRKLIDVSYRKLAEDQRLSHATRE